MEKQKGNNFDKKKMRWQRRIEKSIVEWRQDLARDQDMRKGNRRYQVVKKRTVAVSLLLKRKVQSGSKKIWFVENCTKVRQNTLLKNNQRQTQG